MEASRGESEQLMSGRLDGIRFPVIFIDGVEYADTTIVIALGLSEDGQKRVLGFREGASENAEICKSLIEDLCERGSREQPTLFVSQMDYLSHRRYRPLKSAAACRN